MKKLLTASIIAGTVYGLLALLTGLMINYNVL
ncbi:cation transporter, partial [Enterococcus durans]